MTWEVLRSEGRRDWRQEGRVGLELRRERSEGREDH